jgi:hypothetical protein
MILDLDKYANLKKIINDADYARSKHLTVKEFGKLFVVKYDKIYLNVNNVETLGLFRSVVLDDNGDVISFSPIKSKNLFIDDTIKNKIFHEYQIEEFVEGTMINLFWHPYLNDWEITTRSTIGAKNSFNESKTFRFMFLDACNAVNFDFDTLDKKYSYSFVLQHPENRIVVPIKDLNIYLARMYKFDKSTIEYIDHRDYVKNNEGFKKSKIKLPFIYDKAQLNINSFSDLNDYANDTNLDYKIVGFICINTNNRERIKKRNKNYEIVRRLKGNTPKMQFQYYNLRQNGNVGEFLKYYPEYNKEFSKLRYYLHKWTNELYQYYIKCFIKRIVELKNCPYEFKPHLYKLHNIYLNELMIEKKYVSKKVVIEYINNLEPQRLMYSINHQLKLNIIDEKIANA